MLRHEDLSKFKFSDSYGIADQLVISFRVCTLYDRSVYRRS